MVEAIKQYNKDNKQQAFELGKFLGVQASLTHPFKIKRNNIKMEVLGKDLKAGDLFLVDKVLGTDGKKHLITEPEELDQRDTLKRRQYIKCLSRFQT